MPDFLFLTASTREEGNALSLARAAAAHLPDNAGSSWFDLARPALPPFADHRPDGAPRTPTGRLADLAAATLAADELVIVSPLYWYGLAGPGQAFLDHWSTWLDLPQMDFAARMRGKGLWLVTSRADPAPETVRPLERAMELTANWMGMHWRGALHGLGDAPGDMLADREALSSAAGFFRPLRAPRA